LLKKINFYGKLKLTLTALDWVQIQQPSSDFYGGDTVQSQAEQTLFNFLVDHWDSSVNFSNYDYVYMIFAGDTKNSYFTGVFWPHVWPGGYLEWSTDEVIYDRVAMIGEESKLGTICHEFGHMFGLMDY